MRKLLAITLLFSSFLASSSFAQTDSVKPKEVDKVAKEVSENSKVVEVTDSISAKLTNIIDDYASQKGIVFGKSLGNRIFVYSIKVVDKSPDDPYFGEARVIAFEKAWLDAQKQIALYLVRDIASQTYNQLFRNASEGAENVKLSNWDVLKAKIAGLTDAALNKALQKLGVDPSKFGELSIDKKKRLLFDTFVKTVVRKTYAELSGTVILQTFEGEKEGSYAVAVIAMYSPKLKYLAQAMLHKQYPGFRGKIGHPISYYLPKSPAGYLGSWGVRVVIDEDNYPALISFGQWSYAYRGNNKIEKERRREYAFEQASVLADSYIAEFLNSRLFSEEMTKVGGTVETNAVFHNGDTFVQTADRIVNIQSKKIKRTSKARISGIYTVKRKLLRLPSGQEVAVVVKVWSYRSMKGADALRKDYIPNRKGDKGHKKHVKAGNGSFIIHGRDMTDINDF